MRLCCAIVGDQHVSLLMDNNQVNIVLFKHGAEAIYKWKHVGSREKYCKFHLQVFGISEKSYNFGTGEK